MAGIGFQLKKLFVARGAIGKLRAYAYASIICAGTMLLSFIQLIVVQLLTKEYGISQRSSELLIVLMVYAMGGSLILSSILQMVLSRFIADQVYTNTPERVIPSLFGGAIVLMVPGGIAYGAFLLGVHEVPLIDRLCSWGLFMEMIVIWLQMHYITAAHDYKRIIAGFAAGVVVTIGLAVVLLSTGISIITAVMLSLFLGYGVMVISFTYILLRYFPAGKGSLFYFLGWIGKYPDLVFIGLFNQLGAYIHLILMWFSPMGEMIYGKFFHSPPHDAAAFYAYLVTLPTSINFVVSVEVHFYEKYRKYFSAITQGGTLAEIKLARQDMIASLRLEIFKLAQVQVLAMVVYAISLRYFLESIGFTRDMISMFQVMCVGYSAYAVGNSVVLLQLYFNDRRSALITTATFFVLNFTISLFTRNAPSLYYDLGLVIGSFAMYIVGLRCLLHHMKDVDFYVFCGQPVLADEYKTRWGSFTDRLEQNAVKKEKKPRRFATRRIERGNGA